jgi:predicted dehydrogenase
VKDKFRLALVGVGKVAVQCHLPAALSLPDIEVAALVDPARTRIAELAADYGLHAQISDSVAGLAGKVDGALIASPNHLHAEAAVALLEAGVPVLIEKPLAATVAQGECIVAAAAASGVTAGVAYCSRFQPNVRFMGRLLRDDWFGGVRRFAFQSGTRGGWAPFSAYNTHSDAAGGGVIMITATHFLDRMLHWFGQPGAIEYFDDAEGGPEANAILRLRFDRPRGEPLTAALRFSKTRSLPGGMMLDTAKGRVFFAETDDAWPVLASPGDDVHLTLQPRERDPSEGRLDRFQRQLLDFVAACRAGRDPEVPVAEGLESSRLIESLYAHRRPLAEAPQEQHPRMEAVS